MLSSFAHAVGIGRLPPPDLTSFRCAGQKTSLGSWRVTMTRKNEAGQALIAAVVALGVVLMGFAGLGIDMGYLRYEKRLQQTAADSAAIAGAAELLYGSAGVTNAAKHDSAANGSTDGTNNVTVTVHNPPTSGPHNAAAGYVEVLVAQVHPT